MSSHEGPGPGGQKRWIIAAGGLIAGVSPFLTWVHVALFGDLDLFELARSAHRPWAVPWVIPVAGAVALAAAMSVRRRRTLRVVGGIVGIGLSVLGAAGVAALVIAVRRTGGFVSVAGGPWIGMVGAGLLVVGALWPW